MLQILAPDFFGYSAKSVRFSIIGVISDRQPGKEKTDTIVDGGSSSKRRWRRQREGKTVENDLASSPVAHHSTELSLLSVPCFADGH